MLLTSMSSQSLMLGFSMQLQYWFRQHRAIDHVIVDAWVLRPWTPKDSPSLSWTASTVKRKFVLPTRSEKKSAIMPGTTALATFAMTAHQKESPAEEGMSRAMTAFWFCACLMVESKWRRKIMFTHRACYFKATSTACSFFSALETLLQH